MKVTLMWLTALTCASIAWHWMTKKPTMTMTNEHTGDMDCYCAPRALVDNHGNVVYVHFEVAADNGMREAIVAAFQEMWHENGRSADVARSHQDYH